MQLGVLFPQTEIGSDPVGLRDYAQAVHELGFAHLVSYEHVLGAVPERLPKDYAHSKLLFALQKNSINLK